MNQPKGSCGIAGMGKRLRLKHFFTGEAERTEGLYHSGVCHVVQMVAEKPDLT